MEVERLKIAIEFLKEGSGFKVGALRLEMRNDILWVMGWSKCKEIERLNRNLVFGELEDVKTCFKNMLEESEELRIFIANKNIAHASYFDLSGKASLPICFEMDGVVKWEMNLK